MTNIDQLPQILDQAREAARKATAEYITKNPDQWYPCGFAWVTVREKGSTKLGRALLQNGFKKAYGGGLQIWNPSENPTQWMDAKIVGAQAFANVLTGYGIPTSVGERID